MTVLKTRLLRAKDSFWFLPAVLGVFAVLLAQALVYVDRHLDGVDLGVWGALFYSVGASGSRDLLSTIGGSMLAVAATSFSITISVLATASSNYGPRLVRNFMSDRSNQFVLGVFGATFLYSLMVLRSIRSLSNDGTTFVPDIAVNVAVLLAVLNVAVLVYFIHHIAQSIQVSTLSARVRGELVAVVEALFPATAPDNAVPARSVADGATQVLAQSSGFVVGIDEASLIAQARRHDFVVELCVSPGDHVVAGETVARVVGNDDAIAASVRSAISLGDTRVPLQDIRFAVQQLTEMAVRALSPGTNDPYTAQNALAELAVGLVPLAGRPQPALGRLDEAGDYRVTVTRPEVTDLIDQVFDAMRQYAASDPLTVQAAADLARRIGTNSTRSDIRDAVLRQLAALRNTFSAAANDPMDIEIGRARMVAASTAITARIID